MKIMKMDKIKLVCVLLGISSIANAGVLKIRTTGQPDAYVPTMDSDNSSNLTVKGLKATTATLTTVTASTVNAPGIVPLGGMIAVTPALDTVNSWQPPATGVIKDGFMRADGATVPSGQGSPLQGKVLPNMQTGNRYPRGSTATSWTTGTYTTGGANTATLAAANIPQLSGTFTASSTNVDHTHSGRTDNGGVDHTHSGRTDDGGVNHTHPVTIAPVRNVSVASAAHYGGAWVGGDSSTQTGAAAAYLHGHGFSTGGATAYSHWHDFSTGGMSANAGHNHTTTVTLGTAAGSLQAINKEPAYLEVVWVIRVK